MEQQVIKSKLIKLLTKIEEKEEISTSEYYDLLKLEKDYSEYIRADESYIYSADLFRQIRDVNYSLEMHLHNARAFDKFSYDTADYIISHSRLLPLVLANNKHSKVKISPRSCTFLCQIHNEKTPSLSVVDENDFYHCFGCGAGGGVVSYLKEYERLKFYEIIQLLSQVFMINKKINNPNLSGLVDKYRNSLLSDAYRELLLIKKEKLLNGIKINDRCDMPYIMWNPYKEDYQTNEDYLYDMEVERIERVFQERFDNIDRIRNGIYDSNFVGRKSVRKTKIY